MTKKALPFIVVGVLAAVAIFGAMVFQPVAAQSPTPTTPANPSTTQPQTKDGWEGERGFRGGATDADLATALGITTDQLSTARTTALNNALKKAVEAGVITQQQADSYAANGFEGRGLKGGVFEAAGIDMQALMADALGITTDQLQAAEVTAQNAAIDRAVSAGTITQEQADLMKGRSALFGNSAFQSSMTSAFEAAVKQAVTDGVISQAQADAILKEVTTQGGLFGRGMFGGLGGFGGHGRGGHHGFDGGAPTAPDSSSSGTSTIPLPSLQGGDL